MIELNYKNHGVKCRQIWFAEEIYDSLEKEVDIVSYHGLIVSNGDPSLHTFHTIVNDLTVPDDDILSNCKSNVRNEIRRAEREEVIIEQFYFNEDKNNEVDIIFENFNKAYIDMYNAKGIKTKGIKDNLQRLFDGNALIVTKAAINGSDVAYHGYVSDGVTARLMYSVSLFRDKNLSSNEVGRANRFLHYKDMISFKTRSIIKYDWGGINFSNELKGISEFKKGFGGSEVDVYTGVFPCTALGKIAKGVREYV